MRVLSWFLLLLLTAVIGTGCSASRGIEKGYDATKSGVSTGWDYTKEGTSTGWQHTKSGTVTSYEKTKEVFE